MSGAIRDAVGNLVQAFLDLVADDESSPLQGRTPDEITTTKVASTLSFSSTGETYVDILARHGLPTNRGR